MTDHFFTGERLLRLVATALIRMSRVREPRDPVYDGTVQRAYNHVVLECMRAGTPPPNSVPDLVRWAASTPLGQWPIQIDAFVLPETILLDPQTRTPTQQCLEWAVSAKDAAGELFENEIMHNVLDLTRARESPESYELFRRSVITTPVLTGHKRSALIADFLLSFLEDEIRKSWQPVNPRHLHKGTYVPCARCGLLLVPKEDGGWFCELDRCSRSGPVRPGEPIDAAERTGVFQVERPLRTFITGPGLAETDLEQSLHDLGLGVQMWPDFDAYDLRVTFPHGPIWAIDVKDRANPALLGRGTRAFPTRPPHDSAFLVVPAYRFKDREDYARVFDHHLDDAMKGRVELLSDTALLTLAKEEINAHA
ncbi:hypothetical protein [Nocardiopsis sp. HUAS JQ3]|uniref:pPIWI_RE_Y domain-containing protein n=1 Tax=Nocardiopsis sp. HUAS JQ3 TaxID=3061629 RepID=UPI0023A94521|nr:hypothetical protein [Nocardiopsis sp. HUAS JQ3]WDZ92267.1 hypothetical protein PV789_06940 [Nocardiopsis sp. HUAS JQ3]